MQVPVSVVIPCRNAQTTFAEALDSVRSQTHQPTEVIVVDDAPGAEGRRFLDDVRAELVLIRFVSEVAIEEGLELLGATALLMGSAHVFVTAVGQPETSLRARAS